MSTAISSALLAAPKPVMPWWHGCSVYQIYPRSFYDSNGDGVGDLAGVLAKLDYVKELGVDAIWLNPINRSPMKDCGYDISDFKQIDTVFGDLKTFDLLIAGAHELGIRVLMDFVPNHTSDQHPWFKESRKSEKSGKRDFYVWRNLKADGSLPNNWQSFFGGPAWAYDERSGQCYLHSFLPEQPDLNYRNPIVLKEMLNIMRFWLERGVDGFRVDCLWLLVKDDLFRDEPANPLWRPGMSDRERHLHIYSENLDETHEVTSMMRSVLDQYSSPGRERVMIGEIYLPYKELSTYFGSSEIPECHLPFNFGLITRGLGDWRPENLRTEISAYLDSIPKGYCPNFVLGNHDRPRVASILGGEQAKVATMLLLTLPGTITLYYGDEIGMRNGSIPASLNKDLGALRQAHIEGVSRDKSRTPMQWDDSPSGGFSDGQPWLPVGPDHGGVNVKTQIRDSSSHLSLTRSLLTFRRQYQALKHGKVNFVRSCEDILHYQILGDQLFDVILNFSDKAVEYSWFGRVLATTNGDSPNSGSLRPNEGLLLMSVI